MLEELLAHLREQKRLYFEVAQRLEWYNQEPEMQIKMAGYEQAIIDAEEWAKRQGK